MNDFEKLIELFDKEECPVTFLDRRDERALAEYLLANGVIVPPCKVDTDIFGLFDNDEERKEIYEGKVLCYSLDENNLLWARMRYKNGLTYWHTIDDFGKTVFLTWEEAEKALAERRGNNE